METENFDIGRNTLKKIKFLPIEKKDTIPGAIKSFQ